MPPRLVKNKHGYDKLTDYGNEPSLMLIWLALLIGIAVCSWLLLMP